MGRSLEPSTTDDEVRIIRRTFDQLHAHRDAVDNAAGEPLTWEREVRQGRGARIAATKDGTVGDLAGREANLEWCTRQVVTLAEAAMAWGSIGAG